MKINLKNEYTIAAGKLALFAFVGILFVCIVQISVCTFAQMRNAEKIYELNRKLFPEANTFTECNFMTLKKGFNDFRVNNVRIRNLYYEAKDSNGKLKGYIVFVFGNGFSSELPLCIAFNDTLQIRKVQLLPTEEVKGKIWESENELKIFEGTNTKDMPFPPFDTVDSVSGATITYNGIIEAVKEAINILSNKGE
ncbi:MAG: FMN-binding protein [Spirochaetales bacterium]|nr:FMN-binding protein [Spirochaetales bacterium]